MLNTLSKLVLMTPAYPSAPSETKQASEKEASEQGAPNE